MQELLKRLENLLNEVKNLSDKLHLTQKEQRLLELEDRMQAPNFWQDTEQAQKVSQEYNHLKDFYDFWAHLNTKISELKNLISQNTDESDETVGYLTSQVEALEEQYRNHRLTLLMSGKYDNHDAVFALHAGAGGTDAQDWAAMLLRMFLRYCERKQFKTTIIDESKGQEAGIKSVTVEVRGPFAYGNLKSEAGVHRLVRQSPFNPAHTRETSFALMELIPLLDQQEAITLDPNDLDIEATTSSGHGGQSVNTTYSAIRMTHIPTGLKVSIQNERSQHQNKELALKILTAKVQALEEQKLHEEKKELRGEFKSAEWGNQIRSYVLHPYKLVKDHRTAHEVTDPDRVLNGELDDFVETYLENNIK
jgi:peptide chain release factor 2